MKVLDAETLKNSNQLYGVLFWAPWAEPSILAEQLLDDQAEDYPQITFGRVNVDEQSELVSLFGISSVPTVIFLNSGKLAGKYAGSDPLELIEALKRAAEPITDLSLEDRLKTLINRHKFMVFIKGTPTAPRCGFTSTLLKHLAQLNINYDFFDILSDDEVRQGLKVYSQWPTYPQIYINGELLGGLDIFMDMMQTGQLTDILDTIKSD